MDHNDFDLCYRCVECGWHHRNYESADFCARADAQRLAEILAQGVPAGGAR